MLLYLTKKGTVFKRKPKQGERVTLAWGNRSGEIIPLEVKYIQYYNKNLEPKLNKYLESQGSTGKNFILFEEKNRGQIVPPDARKKLLGMQFTNGQFVEVITKGYTRLTKAERIIIEAERSFRKPVDHRGIITLDNYYSETLVEALSNAFLNDKDFRNFLGNNSFNEAHIHFNSDFYLNGEKAKIIGGYILKKHHKNGAKNIQMFKQIANVILETIFDYGYRFTSLQSLSQLPDMNETIYFDIVERQKMTIDKGVMKFGELEEVQEPIYIRYEFKILG